MNGKDERERVEALKIRFEWLREARARREEDWKLAQRYVAASVFNWDNPLDKKMKRPRRYTSRPTHFLKTLRSGITGYSISPNIVWQKLGFEDLGDMERYGAKDWLEAVERVLYAEFKRSNLYPQVAKLVEDAATYGHGVMLIDEQLAENRIRFMTAAVGELYLDVNEYDEPDTVFRRYSMTLKNAAAFFGEEHLGDELREELKEKRNWNRELVVIHAVYRREEFDADSLGARDMPYASVYIDEGRERILLESGYREFPYAVFVWDSIMGTGYGESPAVHALDDIRLLNKIDESQIKMIQMAAEPAYNVPDTMRDSPVSVVPNGLNYYTRAGEVISPIQAGMNFPIAIEGYKAIEDRVKDWFHVDFFLALQHQQPGNMTATYVMELQGEKAATLSDLVVSLNGTLTKIIQRSFNILWRQRKLPAPPASLEESGARLKVDFTGPLAQAQKKYHESAGIAQGISLIGAVAKISPEALDAVDFDRALKAGLEGAGFPQNAINEDEDIEKTRQARARAMEQQQRQALAMEQQKNLLGNMDKLNEPVASGSALEGLGAMMTGGGAG